jgi:hypothetical protein
MLARALVFEGRMITTRGACRNVLGRRGPLDTFRSKFAHILEPYDLSHLIARLQLTQQSHPGVGAGTPAATGTEQFSWIRCGTNVLLGRLGRQGAGRRSAEA